MRRRSCSYHSRQQSPAVGNAGAAIRQQDIVFVVEAYSLTPARCQQSPAFGNRRTAHRQERSV